MSASNDFIRILNKNKISGESGVYSICSSHPDVIRAGMLQARDDGSIICIESTSNQVDQFGGYTGMTPADFIAFIRKLADETDFPYSMILFGGDHLGPNAWKNFPAEIAMKKARDLIHAYVKAGYIKIHLDTSMRCADDEGEKQTPLADFIVSQRAADLCSVAEETWKSCHDGPCELVYIIGTEVPVPGGSVEREESIQPTAAKDALTTLEITKKAFYSKNLQNAWERVVALVVQPGVEFGDDTIFQYNRNNALALSSSLNGIDRIIFEAHSTDYQNQNSLVQMVKDHFAILKVGPWLTFAYREALFAMEEIEKKLFNDGQAPLSGLEASLENAMIRKPEYWEPYYKGSTAELRIKRRYSFSDRCRYYWNDRDLQKSINRLKGNLGKIDIPLSLISQYLPLQYAEIQKGIITKNPDSLIISKIRGVLRMYSEACNPQH